MIFRTFCFLSIFWFFATHAGNDNYPIGARSQGMANTSLTVADEWSIYNNVAGLGYMDSLARLGFYFERRPQLSAFQIMALAGALPLKQGTLGLGLQRFGDQIYNEQKATVGIGHKIRNVSLGVSVNYMQFSAEEQNTKSKIILEFGGIAEITKTLRFSGHIYNLNQAKLSDYQKERIPTVMKAGLSYRPNSKLMVNGEVEKNILIKETFKVGMEYYILPKKLCLRTGISTYPFVNYGGIGIVKYNFRLDFAFSWHSHLGPNNHLSISYQFGSRKK